MGTPEQPAATWRRGSHLQGALIPLRVDNSHGSLLTLLISLTGGDFYRWDFNEFRVTP